jgi:hypothetical protein
VPQLDDAGLHISFKGKKKEDKPIKRVLDVDNIILCAGQTPLRELQVRTREPPLALKPHP